MSRVSEQHLAGTQQPQPFIERILKGEDCFAAVVQGPPIAFVRQAFEHEQPVTFHIINSADAVMVPQKAMMEMRRAALLRQPLSVLFPEILTLSVLFEEAPQEASLDPERWLLPRGIARFHSALWGDRMFPVTYLPPACGYYDDRLPEILGNWHVNSGPRQYH